MYCVIHTQHTDAEWRAYATAYKLTRGLAANIEKASKTYTFWRTAVSKNIAYINACIATQTDPTSARTLAMQNIALLTRFRAECMPIDRVLGQNSMFIAPYWRHFCFTREIDALITELRGSGRLRVGSGFNEGTARRAYVPSYSPLRCCDLADR